MAQIVIGMWPFSLSCWCLVDAVISFEVEFWNFICMDTQVMDSLSMTSPVITLDRWSHCVWKYIVLHMQADTVDAFLTSALWLLMPHWKNMVRLTWHVLYANTLQMNGLVICFEISATWKENFVHQCRPRCSWLKKKSHLDFSLNLQDVANEVIWIVHISHVNIRHVSCHDTWHSIYL